MHLFELFGRSKVKSGVPAAGSTAWVTARAPATAVLARVIHSAPPAPEDLRRLIFAAVATNDSERLAAMFRENPEGIVGHALDWMKVPEELKPNLAAVRWYGDGLRAVAQYCAERLNQPDIVQRLEELELAS